jgi:hypothetical protein
MERWIVPVVTTTLLGHNNYGDVESYNTFLGRFFDNIIIVEVPEDNLLPHQFIALNRALLGIDVVFETERTKNVRQANHLYGDLMRPRQWRRR